MEQVRISIAVAVTGTSFTETFPLTGDINGMVKYAVLVTPNYTNTVNTTLSVQDVNSQTIFTAAACAKNTTTAIVYPGSAASTTTPFPVMPGYTIVLTLGSAAGGSTAYTAYVTLWID